MDVVVELEGHEDVVVSVDTEPCSAEALKEAVRAAVGVDVGRCEVVWEGRVCEEVPEEAGRVELRLPSGEVARRRLEDLYGPEGVDAEEERIDEAAFCRAIHMGEFERVRLMVQTGWVDGRVLDLALQSACNTKPEEIELVELLLQERVPANSKDVHGRSPLLLAASRGCTGVCERLLAAGADPNARDVSGWSALTLAIRHNNAALALALVAAPSVDLGGSDQLGSTPLLMAARAGLLDVCRAILARCDGPAAQAMVNKQNHLQFSPLYYAAQRGDVGACELLVEAGADPDACLGSGVTALFPPCEAGNADVVALLLRSGADVNRATKRGDTPLMVAARANQFEVVQLLVKAGANAAATDASGNSALTVSAAAKPRQKIHAFLAAALA